jgi:hypothetical protein
MAVTSLWSSLGDLVLIHTNVIHGLVSWKSNVYLIIIVCVLDMFDKSVGLLKSYLGSLPP